MESTGPNKGDEGGHSDSSHSQRKRLGHRRKHKSTSEPKARSLQGSKDLRSSRSMDSLEATLGGLASLQDTSEADQTQTTESVETSAEGHVSPASGRLRGKSESRPMHGWKENSKDTWESSDNNLMKHSKSMTSLSDEASGSNDTTESGSLRARHSHLSEGVFDSIGEEKVPHHFREIANLTPLFCEHCNDMIWGMGMGKTNGRNGVRCEVCWTTVHKACEERVVTACRIKNEHLGKENEDPNTIDLEEMTEKEKASAIGHKDGQHIFYMKYFNLRQGMKYCNYCRQALFTVLRQGLCCEKCKYLIHEKCLAKVGGGVPVNCKQCSVMRKDSKIPEHHWIEGNVDDRKCTVCNRGISGTAMNGFRCSWCSKVVHNECFKALEGTPCDLGPLSKLVLPPTAVIRRVDSAGNFHYKIKPHRVPHGVTPLAVFINKKSGSLQGKTLIKKLSRLLNPIQIFDLAAGGPEPGLQLFKRLKGHAKAVVAGGDGTFGWYLMTVDKIRMKHAPPLALLPLGTGNDLARALDWGGGYEGEKIAPLLVDIITSKEVLLDRWAINIAPKNESGGFDESQKVFVMNNYFSLGLDAWVTLEFHNQRNAHPERFKSRLFNKFKYGTIGAGTLFARQSTVREDIEVELNGHKIELPHDCQSVVILNLNSYMSGANPWGNKQDKSGKFRRQAIDDEMFEVLSISSVLQLGMIKSGITNGTRLGQGNDLTLTLRNTVCAQVDGEGWMQPASRIHVTHQGQSHMLAKAVTKNSALLSTSQNVPMQAK